VLGAAGIADGYVMPAIAASNNGRLVAMPHAHASLRLVTRFRA